MRTTITTATEALLVGGAGVLLALAGNALSPEGLTLGRDYFPAAPTAAAAPPAAPAPPANPAAPPAVGVDHDHGGLPEVVAHALERLAARGLKGIGLDEARALHESELHLAGAHVFIDARREEEYAAGHIPGAWVFDHYRPERHLAEVLTAVPGALAVVVYCNGGNCEDSEFAATMLAQFLPDPSVLSVYVGGVEEWRAAGLPLERGARGSGELSGAEGR